MIKKAISLCLVFGLSVNLTACAKDSNLERINALRTQPVKTLQGVMDDNKEALNYGSFSERPAIKDYKESFNSVSEEEQKRCTELLQAVLSEYKNGKLSVVSSNLYDYLRATLDDLRITGQKIDKIKKFNGYYFMTVNFDTAPNSLGQFKDYANYVGLDNFIYKVVDENGVVSSKLDGAWVNLVGKYLGTVPSTQSTDIPIETQAETTPTEETGVVQGNETAENTDTGTEPETIADTQADIDMGAEAQDAGSLSNKKDDSVYSENLRQLAYDVESYESTFGGSTNKMAFFPALEAVYQPINDGTLTGNGCYNEGINGLTVYGFDRTKLKGQLQITFVFEQDELDKSIMNYIFSYVEGYNSGYKEFGEQYTEYMNVPDFVTQQIGVKLEELDRLVNNNDIGGLMRKDTIEDAGLAFKLAQYRNTTEVNNYTTKMLGVVDRKGNSYLVKAERTVAECPVETDFVSQYKQTVYYLIRQRDVDFVINDIFTDSIELTKQPTIYQISSKYRQLVALNLSGDVPENLQTTITTEVLNKLAEYSTNRQLGKPGGDTGMYSVFDSDTVVLSSEKLEYLNSWLRGLLLKRGVDTGSTMTIKPVQWINGYDTQVEFLTKELIEYAGTDKGVYLENYYVVSNFNNRWVIDDIQNIVQKDVEGQELQLLKSDFSN